MMGEMGKGEEGGSWGKVSEAEVEEGKDEEGEDRDR